MFDSYAPPSPPRLAWQPSLLASGLAPGTAAALPDHDFTAVVRHVLDPCCWVDHAPG